jgi:nucleotide-binding universal stress UspA family protein
MELSNGRPTIVVGVDGSDSSLAAVRWAAHEADRRGATLRLVAVLGRWYGYGPRPEWTDIDEAVARNATRYLSVSCEITRKIASELSIELDKREGHPGEVLVEEAARAALLVIGHQGWGSRRPPWGGSVAIRAAAAAACPVVVVPASAPPVTSDAELPVVVGIDGAPLSEAAIGFAYEQADRRQVPLVAVHCWLDQVYEGEVAALIDWAAVRTGEEALLAQRLAGWAEKYPDVPVRRVVLRDGPAHALVEHSAEAGLLVVGSQGRGAVLGTLLGSVSLAAIRHAHCPVAVVRPTPGQ